MRRRVFISDDRTLFDQRMFMCAHCAYLYTCACARARAEERVGPPSRGEGPLAQWRSGSGVGSRADDIPQRLWRERSGPGMRSTFFPPVHARTHTHTLIHTHTHTRSYTHKPAGPVARFTHAPEPSRRPGA